MLDHVSFQSLVGKKITNARWGNDEVKETDKAAGRRRSFYGVVTLTLEDKTEVVIGCTMLQSELTFKSERS